MSLVVRARARHLASGWNCARGARLMQFAKGKTRVSRALGFQLNCFSCSFDWTRSNAAHNESSRNHFDFLAALCFCTSDNSHPSSNFFFAISDVPNTRAMRIIAFAVIERQRYSRPLFVESPRIPSISAHSHHANCEVFFPLQFCCWAWGL